METLEVHWPLTKVGLMKNCLSHGFIINMRIVNTKCIRKKKKAVGQYVDFIVKILEENSETNRVGGGV